MKDITLTDLKWREPRDDLSLLPEDDPAAPAVDLIRAGLGSGSKWWEEQSAMRAVSGILHFVIDQALAGDSRCGSFLAELLPYLWKKRDDLARANLSFAEGYARIESARPATRKGSALRKLVYEVVSSAHLAQQIYYQWGENILSFSWCPLTKEQLMALPPLSKLPDAIAKWTDIVVYPHFRRIAPQLRNHSEIGKLKKALDENGNFQISRLKPLIRQTVARIAALPNQKYFQSA